MSTKEIGIFDILGPNMIGPSSSHTAGALRIAHLARKMVSGKVVKVEFTLYGSFAHTYRGHGTDKALVGGILGYDTEDARIKDSFRYADEAGLDYSFLPNTEAAGLHPNTVEVTLHGADGSVTTIQGASIGGGNVMIERIDGVDIHLSGDYNTLLIKQADMPGVVAHIAKVLSDRNINIAFMRLYRENKGALA
ncbi:MAG: L-serine ammonia-lyase, iron-sulfur-dependent subunit beta, partial [Angelakisella sp.]